MHVHYPKLNRLCTNIKYLKIMTDQINIHFYTLTFYIHKWSLDIFSIVSLYTLFVLTWDSKTVQGARNTGLFKMIVGVLTTCHTQYIWDSNICIFLFDRTTLQVFVTYLTGPLYVHPLWFYKHQHDNRVRSKQFVACQRWWFQWRFWFVPSVPGYLREEEEYNLILDVTP